MKRWILAFTVTLFLASCLQAVTHRKGIIDYRVKPDVSGNVFLDAYSNYASNDVWEHLLFVFEDTANRDTLFGVFEVPQSYASGADVVITWTTTATSGDVEWEFHYRAVGGNDTESLDQATAQETVGTNDTAPSATDERMVLTIALTDGNLSAGDTVEWFLCRDGTDAGDTISATVLLVQLEFEWDD